MAAIPYSVVEAFKNHKVAKSGAFVSDGRTLKSYALLIAHWDGNDLVIDIDLNSKSYSVTTSRHINAFKAVIC